MKLSQVIIGVLGAGLVAFGLAAPSMNLIGFEARGGAQIMVLGLGVLLLFFAVRGGRVPMYRVNKAYGQIAVLLLNTLVFLAILELLILFSFNLQFVTRDAVQVVGGDENLVGYGDSPWFQTFWGESNEVRFNTTYYPFSLWRMRPYDGETINILADGSRFVPETACDAPDAYRVFVYGGSTMWGVGVPDDMTIPAYLQAEYNARDSRPVCVVNFGESGNVSTQNMIRLIQQLQTGNIPDRVIFYDGVNDVIAAVNTGLPNAHRNYPTFVDAFRTRPHPLIEWLTQSYTFQFVGAFLPRPEGATPTDWAGLSQQVAQTYLSNVRMVSALSTEYGFEVDFFWQPILNIGGKVPTPDERLMAAVVQEPLLGMYTGTWAHIEAAAPEIDNLYYIADVFDGETELLYFDHHHVIPRGNALIATRIADTILPEGE